jgi:hypothetical protein
LLLLVLLVLFVVFCNHLCRSDILLGNWHSHVLAVSYFTTVTVVHFDIVMFKSPGSHLSSVRNLQLVFGY